MRGERNATASPRSTSWPWSGWRTPATILPSVDLPAPFSPTKAWTEPARISMETSWSARVPPTDLPTSRISRWTSPAFSSRPPPVKETVLRASARPLRERQEGVDVVARHDAAVGQVGEDVDTRLGRARPDRLDEVRRALPALGG